MAKEQDERVGRWVIEKGLITARQLQECLMELDQRYRSRTSQSTASFSLGSLLVEKGYVHPADIKAATGTANLPTPEGVDGAPELPDEVKQARRFKDSKYGKYTILKLIATGGMGAVYRAWDNDLSRIVAIKFLTDTSDESINRFMREAQTAARLSHPNITQIYDLGKVDGRHYIAMEYIEGVTLDNLPESARSVEIPKILRIVGDIAMAVEYAHTRGIVHRDLKPQNVILDSASIPHIMDFGLARMVAVDGLHPSGARREVTASGTIVGTPNYLSPEQARGDLTLVGPKADIYSIGATLYALLTGVPPFVGETGMDVVLMVLQQEPIPPRKLNPHIPRDVETIILRALQKDPAARYATANAFGEDLRRFLNEEPILARRPGRVARVLNYFRRRPFLLSGVVSALVLGTLVPVTWYVIKDQQDQIYKMQLAADQERERVRQEQIKRKNAELDLQAGEMAIAKVEAILRSPATGLRDTDVVSRQALESLKKALEFEGVAARALIDRAHLYALIELPELAVLDLDVVIRRNPGRNDLILERGRQHLAVGIDLIDAFTLPPSIPIRPLTLPATAQAHLDAAAADFRAVQNDPAIQMPWLPGFLAFASNARARALTDLGKLAKVDADAAYVLAHVYLRTHDYADAASAAAQAFTLRPRLTKALHLQVAALLRSGKLAEAEALLAQMPADTEDAKAAILRGHVLLVKGSTFEATLAYGEENTRHPTNAVPLISRAMALRDTDRIRAVVYLDDAVERSPELACVALTLRAELRDKPELGLKDADAAVKANEGYAPAYFARAAIRRKLGHIKGAEEDEKNGHDLERR